jgi:AcrR family transcriptional regulator
LSATEHSFDLAPRKRAGRPPRLTRELVIEGALALLAEVELEQFSLSVLARRLGVSVMTLYTYFPSRDALLEAVGARVFELFEAPRPGSDWRAHVRDWLGALRRHLDAYPMATKLMAWNGHIGAAWLGKTMSIGELFKAQGLSGRRLALAMEWFTTASVGILMAQRGSDQVRQMDAIASAEQLPIGARNTAIEIWQTLQDIDIRTSEAFLDEAIIMPLEALIGDK